MKDQLRNIRKGLIGEDDLLAIDPEALAETAGPTAPPAIVTPVPEEA